MAVFFFQVFRSLLAIFAVPIALTWLCAMIARFLTVKMPGFAPPQAPASGSVSKAPGAGVEKKEKKVKTKKEPKVLGNRAAAGEIWHDKTMEEWEKGVICLPAHIYCV